MTQTLTASQVWLDSLRPIISGDDLVEVVAVVNIRYVDEAGETVAIRNQSVNSFALMTPEQLAVVRAVYQGMIDGIKAQYLGAP